MKRWDGSIGRGSEYDLLRSDFELSHQEAIAVIEHGWQALKQPGRSE